KYWPFVFAGYGLIISVPLTGLIREGENAWVFLLVFIMMERIGKALRSPAKDTIISTVAEGEDKIGTGFAFGWQEALDRAGAALGPLIFTLVFMITGRDGLAEYATGYILLGIPFVLLLITVFIVYTKTKKTGVMEERLKAEDAAALAIETTGTAEATEKEAINSNQKNQVNLPSKEKLPVVFWIYCTFTFFSLIGFVTFVPIGFYLAYTEVFTGAQIPMLYTLAMATNAILAVGIGVLYDKIKKKTGNKHSGLLMLGFVPFASALFPFLLLSGSVTLIIVAFLVYGIILATHSTIMRASIADVVSLRKRGTGYGIFNTAFGIALLTGSLIFGFLISNFEIIHVQLFTVGTQAIAFFVFIIMRYKVIHYRLS
ncbi:MAG: MFS transporter, partial [Oscillospiraceae bacterium]|nr:MFS transporter [Oscillospiraceae bacterium]